MTTNVLMIFGAYVLGSIPFGFVLTKAAGIGDIRQIGSGNIGATNVLRTGRKGLAALTLFLDGLKGLVVVLLAKHLCPDAVQVSVLAVILGHLFPVWLKFKGGKGVVTTVGTLIGLVPIVGIMTMLTWLLVIKLSRLSSLAALVAIGLSPFYSLLTNHSEFIVLNFVLVALVFYKHIPNIKRLLNGTEPHVGEKQRSALFGGEGLEKESSKGAQEPTI